MLLLTSGGYGKRTAMEQFRDQKRGGLGVKAIKLTRVRGKLVGARAVLKGMEVFVIASSGVAIRTKIDLPDGVTVSAFTPVDNEEE